jgi:hypothetical protein
MTVLLLLAAPSQPAYHAVDLMPLYWKWWDAASTKDTTEQLALFRTIVVPERPDIYNEKVLFIDPNSKAFDEWFAKYRDRLVPHIDTVRALSETVATQLGEIDARFRRHFPDFHYDGDVYFIGSFGGFDGALRTINGKRSLMFGLDLVAIIHGEGAKIEPIFDHELFHLYHHQFFHSPDDGPVWAGLWEEGLATYVSRKMNPDASAKQIFGLPESTPGRVRDNLSKVATAALHDVDSTDRDTYSKYFLGNKGDDVFPPGRSGYYIGYLIAERLGKTRSLKELAKMQPKEVRAAVGRELEQLAKP